MRTIANRYIDEIQRPPTPLPTIKEMRQAVINARYVLFFFFFCIAMYSLLYFFSQDLIDIAQRAHQGHKTLFFIPIVVALVFSLVHGSFTSHFWEVLGIKAKKA